MTGKKWSPPPFKPPRSGFWWTTVHRVSMKLKGRTDPIYRVIDDIIAFYDWNKTSPIMEGLLEKFGRGDVWFTASHLISMLKRYSISTAVLGEPNDVRD